MKIGIVKETLSGETRVSATPEVIRKYISGGNTVSVEKSAGTTAFIADSDYTSAGATILDTASAVYQSADIILKVRHPSNEELSQMRSGQIIVGLLNRFDKDGLARMTERGLIGFALEAAPRISRAQALDVLSSQANIAGYLAVLTAAKHYPRLMPMLMTAAGTIKAARVVVMGVGVAGLQAIATAKRLGAVVEATDVRPETREQVESLGAKFIAVPLTEAEQELAKGQGGYARDMGEDYHRRQALLVADCIRKADIVITTALIPGRPAPVLVTEAMVQSMRMGSVIVDLAAAQGGNCPITVPDQVVVRHGVTLIGYTNYPAMAPADASALYARNTLQFLNLILSKEGQLQINREDEIVRACLVTETANK